MIIPSKKILTRRNILRGMFAAPAIIAIDNLMPVKAYASLIKPVSYKVKITHDESFFYCPYMPLEYEVYKKAELVEWHPVPGVDTMKNYIIYKEPL